MRYTGEKMTELQQVEFDMLSTFVEICERLNLIYYLVCGTALGAVKYSGFIPWDDDIDVAMLRKDYDIFCREAHKYLQNRYFLQTHETDPFYPSFYAKLRDCNCTFIEKSVSHIDINHGVYIDIFPLDGYPADIVEKRRFERKKELLRLQLTAAYKVNGSYKTALLLTAERILGCHMRTRQTIEKMDKLLTAYPPDRSAIWCNHGNWQGTLEYAPREQYGNGSWAIFEGLQVRVPEMYDEYLTQKYGEWRAELPADQQVGHHCAEVIDLHRPYTDYVVKLGKGKIRMKTNEELLLDGIHRTIDHPYENNSR